MENDLIVDAGSTKVVWRWIGSTPHAVSEVVTPGINALLADAEDLTSNFRNAKESLGNVNPVRNIHYYGAGCATPAICSKVENALSMVWDASETHAYSDMLGAARALFGMGKGIVCILGTGSNSCLYDDGKIISQIPPLGFILGDEGSGAALGKRLIGDAFKRQLPLSILDKFTETYSLTLSEILDLVYKTPSPNKFLASLAPFIKEHLYNPYIYSLVYEEFVRFFNRNVVMYKGSHRLPIGFIGSIACNFEGILNEAASSLGLKIGEISSSPLDGLQKYHSL